MVTCGGALTSFHRVLPTVTLGYAVIDLLDGMKMGIDFLTHGVVLFTFALYMCENEKNEILSTMLALEVRIVVAMFTYLRFCCSKWSLLTSIALSPSTITTYSTKNNNKNQSASKSFHPYSSISFGLIS